MAAPTAGIAGAIDPALQRDIASLAVPGLLIGHRTHRHNWPLAVSLLSPNKHVRLAGFL